jgi:alkanesulfonate monooxygenase SsuD/methylene tetrahydromethanopterin reductase-like flavin-dependent oxidoreductase (luciferase family)
VVALSISVEGMFGLTWPLWRRLVAECEQLGFHGLFRSDHFTLPLPVDLDSLELLVSLTYLADHTSRVHFGSLVAPLSFRDPVLLARQALALDDLSGGRMVLGLGAGWMEREHEMFGYDLGDVPTRSARLGEGLELITRLLRSDDPVSYHGRFYQLQEAVLLPRPQRHGGPPVMVGGAGPRRTLPLVARHADIWNGQHMTPAEFRERSALLDDLIRAEERHPKDVRRTMTFIAICGRDEAEFARRLSWIRRLVPIWGQASLDDLMAFFQQELKAFVGTPHELIEYIQDFAAAGVDEIMLQWTGMDDIEGLTVLAEQVLPACPAILPGGLPDPPSSR